MLRRSDDPERLPGYLPYLNGHMPEAEPTYENGSGATPSPSRQGMNAFFQQLSSQPDASPSDQFHIAQDCGLKFCLQHRVAYEPGARCSLCVAQESLARSTFRRQRRHDSKAMLAIWVFLAILGVITGTLIGRFVR